MDAAIKRATPSTRCYQRRRPEKTLWYRTVQAHFETWLALTDGPGDESTPAHIEQAFRRYLECGILAHGFARAYCDECKHDFLIAFSCKGRGVCPSCNTRRMAETAAHLMEQLAIYGRPRNCNSFHSVLTEIDKDCSHISGL